MDEQTERLFAGFPLTSVVDWEARIREDLKGADYEKKLIWRTLENLRIKPYYTAEDLIDLPYTNELPGVFPYVRGSKTLSNDWEIRQDFRVFNPETTVQQARQAVEQGITAIGYDLTVRDDLYFHDFRKLIKGFTGGKASLNFITGATATNIMDYLIKALDEEGEQASQVRGSLGYDALGYLTATGSFYRSAEEDFREADSLLLSAVSELPWFRVLSVNSCLFSDSGASVVQELAFGLAMAAEYLNKMTESGHSVQEISRHLQWNLGTGSNYFMEIARVRAARLLYSALVSAYDSVQSDHSPVFIHCTTTGWNKTLYDPNVNMLRLTTEAMAAVLGGCNSLLVKPYDSWYREPGDFSERIARNIQIILKEESYFDKVVDPGAGSYYIESLTQSLVDNAWQLFLRIDESGGYSKNFVKGFIREEVMKTVTRRTELISSGKEVLVGTNRYPSFQEAIREQVDPEIAFRKVKENPGRIAEPHLPARAGEEFEKLRLAVEERPEGRPKVFMLTLGNVAMRLARSQFSCNFFACAGYEVIDNPGFSSAEEGVEAALQERADIIVVCSGDDEYAQVVPEVFDLTGRRAMVVVAGAPACMEELKKKGITEFIHVRSNILETLRHFHIRLGIIK